MSNSRKYQGGLQSFLMKASTTIIAGELVIADTDGLAVPSSDLSGGKFLGVCAQGKVSTSSPDKYVLVYTEGHFKLTTAVTLTQANMGDPVYAGATGGFDLTGATGHILAGHIVKLVDANTAWVKLV